MTVAFFLSGYFLSLHRTIFATTSIRLFVFSLYSHDWRLDRRMFGFFSLFQKPTLLFYLLALYEAIFT